MGNRQVMQATLYYEFSLQSHVPSDHLLRSIDRFVALDGLRRDLAAFYSDIGRPSVDPELMIRMLIVGYCFGIRSERRLCEGGPSEPRLPVVLSARARRLGARPFDLLEEPAWPVPRGLPGAAGL